MLLLKPAEGGHNQYKKGANAGVTRMVKSICRHNQYEKGADAGVTRLLTRISLMARPCGSSSSCSVASSVARSLGPNSASSGC
jgi:hypothetical protein